MNITYICVFSIYGLILFSIAFLAYQKTSNTSDYILGSRKLGTWTTAISAGASDMSGWLLLGLPGYAYLAGLEAIWIAIGLLAGCSLNWLYIAPRLRTQTELVNNAVTLPEFFANSFDDKTHSLKLLSALFILIFYFFYTCSGLVAAGKLFETVFDIPYDLAVITGTTIILLYTAGGGFFAVSWTDLFQGLLMLIMLLLTMIISLTILQSESSANTLPVRDISHWSPFTDQQLQPLSVISIISLISWGLGYFGQPHILLRFMAIKNVKAIQPATIIAISWTALCLIFSICIGLAGFLLLETPLDKTTSETVYLQMLGQFFPSIIAGFALAAVLAAIMSTADSQLLVAATTITRDLIPIVIPNIHDHTLLWLGRLMVIILAILAAVFALQPGNSILGLVAYAWAGFGAAFGPLIIMMLYRKIHKAAAIAGMLSGGLTVIIWKQMTGGIFDMYELFPGFLLSFFVIYVLNQITTKEKPT